MSRAAAAALVLLALLLQPRAVVPFAPEGLELTLAERLLHGLPGPFVSMNLPMQSVVTGLVFGHGPSWLALWAPELLHAATVVLTFTLGALLHSLLAGGAAAALLAAAVPFLGFDFMSFYAVLVLLSAHALAWAADREQARRTSWPGYLATGLALGLTLLQRSPLFLLPFLLAGHLWLRRRSRGEPPPVREALALIAPPVLLLLPWMRLNWLCFGVPSPFELGRARFNIVTGALGRVTTLEGVLVGAGPASGESAVLWAAARVLAHPLDFLLAAALRLKAVLSWQPWLAGLAAVSAWTMRGRLPHRQVAVLAAYFLGIHCLMPVKPFYFTALWPVAAALAGAALAAPFRAEEGAGRRACAGAAGLGLAAASVLGLFTLSVVWAYPGRAAAPSRLEAEERRRPELPCLRTEYGRDLLRRGRVDDAVAQLRAAGRAGPRRDRELDLAWALLARGSGGADLIDRVDLSAGSWEGAVRGGVLRALGALQRGRVPAAAAAFAEAELRYSARYAPAPGATEADREAQRALALSDPGLAAIVLELLRAWPEPRRGALLARFRGEVLPAFASVRFPSQAELHEDGLKARIEEALARAAAEAKKDRRAEALASLALVERLSPDDRALERVVVAYRSLGEFSRALAVLKKTGRGGPRDAGALLDLSAEAARSSRAAEALEILACVEGPGLGRNDRRRLASAYRGLGEYAFALTVLKRARLDGPLDPAMLLDLAAEAAKSGRTAERLAILSFAESLPLSPESARRLAFAYRDAGAYSLSLSVLRKAGLDGPRGAGA
ncbi:MAG: hypothetical protein HYX59_15095, partial [Elusimicrobia bacterium]|nr:hypothetical protein [Elusimicrobiota bacterium]